MKQFSCARPRVLHLLIPNTHRWVRYPERCQQSPGSSSFSTVFPQIATYIFGTGRSPCLSERKVITPMGLLHNKFRFLFLPPRIEMAMCTGWEADCRPRPQGWCVLFPRHLRPADFPGTTKGRWAWWCTTQAEEGLQLQNLPKAVLPPAPVRVRPALP